MKPLHERFEANISYEPMSGCWLWVGWIDGHGYGLISNKNHAIAAHRVSWMLINGPIPDGLQIDHMCHNPRCVNPSHLRLATSSQNKMNSVLRSNNKSGYKGVSFDKENKKWRATIRANGKQISLGRFTSLDLAYNTYCEAARRYFGEFANFGTVCQRLPTDEVRL